MSTNRWQKYNKKLKQVERIKLKLGIAKNTDRYLEVFGSKSHEYVLNSPLSESEVNDFEKQYNFVLPECYRTFLTQIGNGGINYTNSVVGDSGAGPCYGVFSLGHIGHFICDPVTEYHRKAPYFNSLITDEIWTDRFDSIEDDLSDEQCDIEIGKMYSGIINIGYCGCSGYYGIMLNGVDKGKVVYTYDEFEYCPHFAEENNFLDWYENWLNRIISGKEILRNGWTTEGEDACVESFLSKSDEYWKLVKLAYIRYFDEISKDSIAALWIKYYSEDEPVKSYILDLLIKFDYENGKVELEKKREHPMEIIRTLHLFAPDKIGEWHEYISSLEKITDNKELVEYVKFINVEKK